MVGLIAATLALGQERIPDTLLASGSLWRYVDTYDLRKAGKPTIGFNALKFDDSDWWLGRAPFGNVLLDGQAPRTQWDSKYPAKLRTWVEAKADYDTIEIRISVDNAFTLFLDGGYVSHDGAEGAGFKWEHVVTIPNVKRGKHLVAFLLADWHQDTWFDCEIVGHRARR